MTETAVDRRELEAAEARARFARARIEGLKRRKEEAEQARRDRIEALKERALALDPGAVRKLEEKARKALDAYVEVADAYGTELNGIVQELSALGPLPEDLELDTSPDRHGLVAGPERRAPINPIAVCTVLAYEVLRTHMPRREIDLSISKYR